MDILKLFTSVLMGIAVQTATLFVFHKLRGPFKELGILQKEMVLLREKMEEHNNTTVRFTAKKHYKRKASVPKSRSRSGRNSPLRYEKRVARIGNLEEGNTPLQDDPSDVQACSSAQDTIAPEAKIQDLERLCYDLDAKMKHFKKRTVSNQLRIKDYAKGIKEYAENLQADQDALRHEVGNIFYKLDDEMNLLDDDVQIRLSNVESRVFDLIQAKLKAERRKGWCRKTIRII